MRPPHEIKRGQRGAKPGVPRKSRSTDDEAEELFEAEAMEAAESEVSEEEAAAATTLTRPPVIADYHRIDFGLDATADNQPIDLVNHDKINSLPANALDCFKTEAKSPKSVKTEASSPRSRSLSPGAKSNNNVLAQRYIKNERMWDTMLSRPLTGKID